MSRASCMESLGNYIVSVASPAPPGVFVGWLEGTFPTGEGWLGGWRPCRLLQGGRVQQSRMDTPPHRAMSSHQAERKFILHQEVYSPALLLPLIQVKGFVAAFSNRSVRDSQVLVKARHSSHFSMRFISSH